MSQRNNEVISDFIEIYKSEPCLWKVKEEDYHNRDKRDAAYRKLVDKLKEIDPNATETSVKNKINSLRSNVRKEQKKIDSSMKSGASSDDVYKPSLWYFELFDFLKDQDNPRASVSNLSPESDNDEVNVDDPSPEETQLAPTLSQEERRESTQPTASTGITRPGPSKKRKSNNDDISAEILSTVRDHFKQPQPQIDCCELLGRTVAVKMRGIKDKRLHLMFEKRINDILYDAEMCALNYSHSTFTSPQHSIPSTTPSLQHYTPTPSPSPQHYTPTPSPSPQHYTPTPSPSPQHYTPTPAPSPQHYTPTPAPSPQHYTPTPAPFMHQEQNLTPQNNTETAGSFISTFMETFE